MNTATQPTATTAPVIPFMALQSLEAAKTAVAIFENLVQDGVVSAEPAAKLVLEAQSRVTKLNMMMGIESLMQAMDDLVIACCMGEIYHFPGWDLTDIATFLFLAAQNAKVVSELKPYRPDLARPIHNILRMLKVHMTLDVETPEVAGVQALHSEVCRLYGEAPKGFYQKRGEKWLFDRTVAESTALKWE